MTTVRILEPVSLEQPPMTKSLIPVSESVNENLPDSFLSALNCAMSHSENPTIPVRRTTIVIKTNRALFKQRYAFVPNITEVFKMQSTSNADGFVNVAAHQ